MNDLQILIVTLLGAALIAIAVWLIVVRRDSSRNVVRFLGMEFDLSTPGVVVLLAGCGLLVLPAFVPHRPGGLPSLGPFFAASSSGGAEATTTLQQVTVLAAESEPNDSVPAANRIALGETVAGALTQPVPEDTFDYYLLELPAPPTPKRVVFRTRGEGSVYRAYITVWNEKEEELADTSAPVGDTISLELPPSPAYLIRLTARWAGGEGTLHYQLVVVDQ